MAKILIVDDDSLSRELLVTLLGYDGHETVEAKDGIEALRVVKSERPRLVICDILMPTMDGYEFVRRLRADPLIAATEVLFHTASYHESEARNLASMLGVTRILTKPCEPETMIATIDEVLGETTKPIRVIEQAGFDEIHQQVLTDKLVEKATALEQANQRLAALNEMNLKLAVERDAKTLLGKVCEGARDLTGARFAIICAEAPFNGRNVYFVGYGLPEHTAASLSTPALTEGVFATVMAERRAVRFSNPSGSPEAIGLPRGYPCISCGVAVPIASAISVFGWICLVDKVGAREFSEEDEWISAAHAAQAGQIFENWSLYGQLEKRAYDLAAEVESRRRTEEQLQRVLRARRVMTKCTRAVARAVSERELLDVMCQLLESDGEYVLAWIGLVDGVGGGAIHTVASAGDSHGSLQRLAINLRDRNRCHEVDGIVIGGEDPLVIPDIARAACVEQLKEVAHAYNVESAIIISIKYGREVFGALGLADMERFDEDEIDLLTELADDIAYGIHTLRARIRQREIEKTLQLRTRAIEECISGIVISRAMRDEDNPITYVNPAFTALTGYAEREVLGRNPRFMLGDDLDQPEVQRIRVAVRDGHDARVTLRFYRKDGSPFWNDVSLAAVHDEDGHVGHFIAVFNDITEQKLYEVQLERQANEDSLTGVANRNLLGDRLLQAITRATRDHKQFAVLLLDLDRFKVINDSLGHTDGDKLLRFISEQVSSSVRHSDTVARLGGDEFVVVMESIASEADAAVLAEKILDSVSRSIRLSGRDVQVTASMGIALFPKDGETADALLRDADVAMYRAKELGRNRLQFYSPEMNARALERLELENGLRQALSSGQFELHYQPKVDLRSGAVTGAEALLRWRRPQRGLVPPLEFIPLAEESGLIVPIGRWVVHEACHQLRRWRDEGIWPMSVAVNVAARQFEDEGLFDCVQHALETADVPGHALHVEVTESAVMANPNRTVEILAALKTLGVGVSLDDFGTGYSSLSYLKRFPIDSVKIDRSFVTDIVTSPEDAGIAGMIVALAHSLKQTVIAEGVEDAAQFGVLRRLQCDEIQGYFFSRPLPSREFIAFMREPVRSTIGMLGDADARTVLIVDDEPNIAAALYRLLRRDGYNILRANGGAEGMRLLAENNVQVIISDQRMPGMSGTEFLSRAWKMYPATTRILLTGYFDLEALTEAVNRGAVMKVLLKPWEDKVLRRHVQEAFEFQLRQLNE